MFEKLGLPKPVYHVHQLEQGRYRSEIEFHRTIEHFRTSASRTRLSSRICEDGETSMNHAADMAIEYMEIRERKVLVDYNYYQLEQQKKTNTRVSDRLLEKTEEINQHRKTIKQMTKEACEYVEEVRAASKKIHGIAGVALDPATSISVSNLKQALLEIQGVVAALQNTTDASSQLLEEKGMYSDDDVADSVYSGHSDEDSADDCHQDMDDDDGHYV